MKNVAANVADQTLSVSQVRSDLNRKFRM